LNPCFLRLRPARSRKSFFEEDSERVSRHGNGWTEPDVISFVIGWPAFGDGEVQIVPEGGGDDITLDFMRLKYVL